MAAFLAGVDTAAFSCAQTVIGKEPTKPSASIAINLLIITIPFLSLHYPGELFYALLVMLYIPRWVHSKLWNKENNYEQYTIPVDASLALTADEVAWMAIERSVGASHQPMTECDASRDHSILNPDGNPSDKRLLFGLLDSLERSQGIISP